MGGPEEKARAFPRELPTVCDKRTGPGQVLAQALHVPMLLTKGGRRYGRAAVAAGYERRAQQAARAAGQVAGAQSSQ